MRAGARGGWRWTIQGGGRVFAESRAPSPSRWQSQRRHRPALPAVCSPSGIPALRKMELLRIVLLSAFYFIGYRYTHAHARTAERNCSDLLSADSLKQKKKEKQEKREKKRNAKEAPENEPPAAFVALGADADRCHTTEPKKKKSRHPGDHFARPTQSPQSCALIVLTVISSLPPPFLFCWFLRRPFCSVRCVPTRGSVSSVVPSYAPT